MNIFTLQTARGIRQLLASSFPNPATGRICRAREPTTHGVRFRRMQFMKNSSDKSQGYFKVGEAGRCVCGMLT